MKIVFVDPKGVWEGLNNGIASIVAGIRDEHTVHVVDFVNKSGNVERRLQTAEDADFVGISMKSFTLDESIMVASMVKKINPNAKIIAGGPHVMVDGYNLLVDNPIFDLGVFGEGEYAFREILDGKDPATFSGVIYRKNGEVVQNHASEWIGDLDALPFPTYDDFDSINTDGKIEKIENWPLVTSRGCPYTCTYCLKNDALIHTDVGMVKIEDLEHKNDIKVLSHSGNFMPIKHFFKRKYSGKITKIKAKKLPIVEATVGHKFHVIRDGLRDEIPAENIKKGDFLTVQLPSTRKIEYIDIKEIVGDISLIYEYSRKVNYDKMKIAIELHNNGLSTRKIAAQTGISKSFVHVLINNNFEEKKKVENKIFSDGEKIGFRLSRTLPTKIPVTKDLCRLFGYYLAEGCVSKHIRRPNSYYISWTFNKKEVAYIRDVKRILKKVFGVKPLIVNQNNVTRVYVSNSILGLLFEKLFGRNAREKHISQFLMGLENEYLQEILKGWLLGDGSIYKSGKGVEITGASVSPSLGYQFLLIAFKIGLSPNLSKNKVQKSFIDGGEIKGSEFYYRVNFCIKKDVERLSRIINGESVEFLPDESQIRDESVVYFPVESIEFEDFSGMVYNIEVDEDHTYTANGFLVNNCNVPTVIGRKFRTRSGENILAELRYAQKKYGSKEFKVLDDNFTLQMDRAKEICKLFIEEKLDMKWTCPNGIRADRLDEELCSLMKEAGCYSMSIGVESGDPDVFDKIKKGERLIDVEKGIRLAQAAGIKVHGFFIIGLVGSTYEADKRSMEFAKRLGITASWGILVPYPGTEVWEQVKKDSNARVLRDWKEGFHIGARPKPVFDTAEYTADERVRAYYYANMTTIKKKDIPRAAKLVIKGLISGR